jgi:hypothetical protein
MNDELRELYELKHDADDWVDRLVGDTWGWDKWFLLMRELLQYKAGGPPDDDTDPKDIVRCQYQGSKEHGWPPGEPYDWVMSEYPDTITWDAEKLRDLIGRIEQAMFDAVAEIHIPMNNYLHHEIERLEGEEE